MFCLSIGSQTNQQRDISSARSSPTLLLKPRDISHSSLAEHAFGNVPDCFCGLLHLVAVARRFLSFCAKMKTCCNPPLRRFPKHVTFQVTFVSWPSSLCQVIFVSWPSYVCHCYVCHIILSLSHNKSIYETTHVVTANATWINVLLDRYA